MLLGFSFGADVLPFALEKLDADSRAAVAALGLVSPGRDAAFEFHAIDWLRGGEALRPMGQAELAALGTLPVDCLYGDDDETVTLCTEEALPPTSRRS